MRLLSGLLFVALTGSVTLADEAAATTDDSKPAEAEAKPAEASTTSKVPLRVVRLLPETHQVLLIHKIRGTHVVAEVGQDVDGFIVDEISGDEVTLVSPTGAEIILTAPDTTWRRRAAERRASAKKGVANTAAAPAPGDPLPEDPYADVPLPAGDATQLTGHVRVASADPAAPAPSGSIRSASAPATIVPADPYADPNAGITAFAEAVGADAPAAPAPTRATGSDDMAGALAAAATGSPAPATGTTPATTPAVPATAAPTTSTAAHTTAATGAAPTLASVGITLVVPRAEVDAALADFGATAVTFDAKFVAAGLRIDSIAAGTLLEKAGLAKGDTITSVDGKPLRSFDDAADLYARLPTARGATISVERAGKPVTLKVAIR